MTLVCAKNNVVSLKLHRQHLGVEISSFDIYIHGGKKVLNSWFCAGPWPLRFGLTSTEVVLTTTSLPFHAWPVLTAHLPNQDCICFACGHRPYLGHSYQQDAAIEAANHIVWWLAGLNEFLQAYPLQELPKDLGP